MPTIEFKNVSSSYYNENTKVTTIALNDLSVTFLDNKITAIIGENGSGKTTLLKCICDFQPYKGEITINGVNVDKILTKNRNIGYVTQELYLNPKLNVFDNIAFPLLVKKMNAQEVRKIIYELAEQLKISHLLNRRINEISKGQLQRVCIAKTFVKNPDIILLDEPFANLDKDNKEIAFNLIRNKMKAEGKICLFVTHNIEDAVYYCDEIVTLKEGKVENVRRKGEQVE